MRDICGVLLRLETKVLFCSNRSRKMAETVTLRSKKTQDFPQRAERAPSKSVDNKLRPSFPDQPSETAMAVPFKGHIPGGMRPGKRLMVMGIVDSQPDRFYIGLTCGRGTSKEPPTDVALELCVRFKDRQVLRRARVSGTWGDKEKDIPFFPFIRDQPFRMEIRCEQSRLRVFVDGEQLFHFHHRVPLVKDIDTLWINGSMRITKLG